MPEHEDTTTAYDRYAERRHRPAHARRTAEVSAAFLLPHLESGMRVLDAGCGPGSITLGLAARAAPGECVGVDLDPAAIDAARALAAERDIANARFECADLYRLPFDDNSFDAAYSNAVLQHLADPVAVLREICRVLRPGAVIGVAAPDLGTGLTYPASPLLDRAYDIAVRLREVSGGTPYAGRRLRELLLDAGFVRPEATVAAGCDGNDATVRFMGEWQAADLEQPVVIEHLTALGITTADELRNIAAAWREWASSPGAFAARYGVTCLAWKP